MQGLLEQVEHMPRRKALEVTVGKEGLDKEETCEGTQYSPRISIRNLQAPFLAVIMEDIDVPQGAYNHWLLWDVGRIEIIPQNLPKSEELARPIRGRQGRNSFGNIGYTAPCPPQGARHRFRFRVFGVNDELNLRPGATGRDLEKALEGSIIQYGEAMVTYERPSGKTIPGPLFLR